MVRNRSRGVKVKGQFVHNGTPETGEKLLYAMSVVFHQGLLSRVQLTVAWLVHCRLDAGEQLLGPVRLEDDEVLTRWNKMR